MKKLDNKTGIIVIFVIILIFSALIYLILTIADKANMENVVELMAEECIPLSQIGIDDEGFTCTGATYDPSTMSFFVGDAGRTTQDQSEFKAVIRQVSSGFDEQLNIINCYELFDDMKDIQGITLDEHNNIWFCSYGENLVRCISQKGESISSFHINNPSGIAYSVKDETFWILTNKHLLNCTKNGEILKMKYFKKKGQDQLFFDSDNDDLYITVGNDYFGDSYVYVFNVQTEKIVLRYVLKDSYAIEGISIVGKKMYIFNDGLYHNAATPVNQVNVYAID